MKIINNIFICFVRLYQKFKQNRKPRCLHYPSCSNYAILALKKYNLFVALFKIINRIRDCNPFSSRPYIDYP